MHNPDGKLIYFAYIAKSENDHSENQVTWYSDHWRRRINSWHNFTYRCAHTVRLISMVLLQMQF